MHASSTRRRSPASTATRARPITAPRSRASPARTSPGGRAADVTVTDEHQSTDTPELAEFRQKVRAFLAEHAPKRAARGDDEGLAFEASVADLPTQKAFQAALADAGLAGL